MRLFICLSAAVFVHFSAAAMGQITANPAQPLTTPAPSPSPSPSPSRLDLNENILTFETTLSNQAKAHTDALSTQYHGFADHLSNLANITLSLLGLLVVVAGGILAYFYKSAIDKADKTARDFITERVGKRLEIALADFKEAGDKVASERKAFLKKSDEMAAAATATITRIDHRIDQLAIDLTKEIKKTAECTLYVAYAASVLHLPEKGKDVSPEREEYNRDCRRQGIQKLEELQASDPTQRVIAIFLGRLHRAELQYGEGIKALEISATAMEAQDANGSDLGAVRYNLACYTNLLRRVTSEDDFRASLKLAALKYLDKAIEVAPELASEAKIDPDLVDLFST